MRAGMSRSSVQRYQAAITDTKVRLNLARQVSRPRALGDPFNQEGHHGKDEQPSVFGKKGDGLPGRFEDEAHDRADEARQGPGCLFADVF